MKGVTKKVPLFPNSAKKDTLISDLLRSEPRSKKGTLFWEFPYTHVNTYRKSVPPGRAVEEHLIFFFISIGLIDSHTWLTWFAQKQEIFLHLLESFSTTKHEENWVKSSFLEKNVYIFCHACLVKCRVNFSRHFYDMGLTAWQAQNISICSQFFI